MDLLSSIKPAIPNQDYYEQQATDIANLLTRINANEMPYDITCYYTYLFPSIITTLKENGWLVYTFVEMDKRYMHHLLISRIPSLYQANNLNPNNFVQL